jgi:hypothetical protein
MPKKKATILQRSDARPALTPEARESQLIALAYDLVEQRLRDGTATSQETTHFLKMGSPKERKDREIQDEEIKLLRAKTENLQSARRIEELMSNALAAMKSYSPTPSEENDE